MANDQVSTLKFWIRSDRSLAEIAAALKEAGVIVEYSYDYENVYEWFTATPTGHVTELNVSRQHRDGELDRDEPLLFMLRSSSPL